MTANIQPNIAPTQSLVNEHIFGQVRLLDQMDPKQGITNAKVEAHHAGNIPGVVEHWDQDIERRKKSIIELNKRTFTKRISSLFKQKGGKLNLQSGGVNLDEATGREIYNLHSTRAAKGVLNRLMANPTNKMARLELVSIVGKSNNDLSIEARRTLFLQATVAATLGELNHMGLSITLWAQEQYFIKLIEICKEEIKSIESKLGANRGKNAYQAQADELEQRIKQIKTNIAIILHYQKGSKKASRSNSSRGISLRFEKLKEMMMAQELDTKEKELLIQKSLKIMILLRHLPLLHKEGEKYLDLLTKLIPEHPMLYFMRAKINMHALIFAVDQYREGRRDEKLAKSISEKFKTTYHQYSLAAKNIKNTPQKETDFKILIESVHVLHYYYNVAISVLQISLPKDWLKSAYQKAQESLVLADDGSGKNQSLSKAIIKDMHHAGLIT